MVWFSASDEMDRSVVAPIGKATEPSSSATERTRPSPGNLGEGLVIPFGNFRKLWALAQKLLGRTSGSGTLPKQSVAALSPAPDQRNSLFSPDLPSRGATLSDSCTLRVDGERNSISESFLRVEHGNFPARSLAEAVRPVNPPEALQ